MDLILWGCPTKVIPLAQLRGGLAFVPSDARGEEEFSVMFWHFVHACVNDNVHAQMTHVCCCCCCCCCCCSLMFDGINEDFVMLCDASKQWNQVQSISNP